MRNLIMIHKLEIINDSLSCALHNKTLEHPRPFIIELNSNEPDSKKQMYWAGSPAPLSCTISIPYLVYRNENDEQKYPKFRATHVQLRTSVRWLLPSYFRLERSGTYLQSPSFNTWKKIHFLPAYVLYFTK